jgi:hypothetical protein
LLFGICISESFGRGWRNYKIYEHKQLIYNN